MRVYEVIYRIEDGSLTLTNILYGQFNVISEDPDSVRCIWEKPGKGYKEYIYFKNEKRLVERYHSRMYSFECTLAAFLTFAGLVGRYYISPIFLIVSIMAGLLSISLFYILFHINEDNPELFFRDPSQSGKTIPSVSRIRNTKSFPTLFMIFLFFINAQPVVFPNWTMVSIISIASLCPLFASVATRDNVDPITSKLLVLSFIAFSPIFMILANLNLYLQYSTIKRQHRLILERLLLSNQGDLAISIYNTIFSHTLSFVFIFSLMAILLGIKLAPIFCEGLSNIDRVDHLTLDIGSSKATRQTIFMTLTIQTAIISAVPVSQIIGKPLIKISNTYLFILYSPAIIIVIWFCYWVQRWLHLRRLVSEHTAISSVRDLKGNKVEVAKSNIEAVAISADILGKRPAIIIDKQIQSELSDKEIKAIYYHEIFHLKNGHNWYQTLVNLPLIGYLVFLLLIDPSDIYRAEFQADDYAARKIDKESVISALEKTELLSQNHKQKPIKAELSYNKNVKALIKIAWDIKLFSIYSPTRGQRRRRFESDRRINRQ